MSTTERTVSEIEQQLYANQAMKAGGGAAEALARLKQARAHLAYIQLALMAPACGFNLAKPDADMAGLTRAEVTALAAAAMEYLTSLLPPK